MMIKKIKCLWRKRGDMYVYSFVNTLCTPLLTPKTSQRTQQIETSTVAVSCDCSSICPNSHGVSALGPLALISFPQGKSFGEGDGTLLQYSCLENPMDRGAWQAAVHRVAKSRTRLSDFTFTFHFHALEKEMATHSSVLAWRIPGMVKPGGLPSMGLHRVGHD